LFKIDYIAESLTLSHVPAAGQASYLTVSRNPLTPLVIYFPQIAQLTQQK
jgi:hypothetical protein